MVFCTNCGHRLPYGANFCPRCGARAEVLDPEEVSEEKEAIPLEEQASTAQPEPPSGPKEVSRDSRIVAMVCHLSVLSMFLVPFGNILGPLATWLLNRRRSPFVDAHGKEALNFQISFIIFFVALFIAAVAFSLLGSNRWFFWVLFVALPLFNVISVAVAAVRAYQGAIYRYPLSLRLVR